MQLKTVGESLNALNVIKSIVNNTSLLELEQNIKLANSLSGYSVEAVKAAIAQSTLNETQIKAILVEKGFKGQLLETTTAELAQATATNALAASEAGATASTLGLGAAFKGLGASIKAFALSNPILTAIAAIGVAIYGAVKAYDAFTDSIEEVKERTDALLDTYNSAISEANSNAKTIEGLAEKYETLSKGVNNLGENVSLTAEEYSEYNEIVNQIADMFPTLVRGYTDEGNAILSLKGNVEGLRDAYKEAQMEAYNLLIASGKDSDGNDILKDANNVINNAKMGSLFGKGATLGGNKQAIEYIDEISKIFSQDNYKDILLAKTGLGTSLDPSDDDETLRQWFTYLTGIPADGQKYISDITDEQVAEILKQLKISKQTLNAEISSVVDNVESIANAYLMTNEDYAKLDEQSKKVASIIINSLNADIVSGFGENKENVGKYVNDIVQIILTNPEVQDALIGLFSLDITDMPVNEAKSLIETYIGYIAKEIGEDPLELEVRLGFDDTVDTAKRLQNSIRQLTDDHGITDREEYSYLMGEIDFQSFTQAQAEMWLEVTLGARNATEAVRMYEDAIAESSDNPSPTLSISSTISQLNTQLKPTFDSLKSAYNDIFTSDGFALDSIDILSTCDSIKSKLDDMAELGLTVDYSSYEDFVKVLSDSESTSQDVETAFDSLATSITQAALSGKEDFATMKAALEDLGVVNNEIVAFDALISNTEALKEAGLDLADATDEQIQAFAEAMVSAENYDQAINLLRMQKILCNENPLSVAEDINELYRLAQAAGIATNAIQQLMGLNSAYEMAAESGNTIASTAVKVQMDMVRKQVVDQFAWLKTDVDFGDIGGGKSAAKSAGKDAGKSYADALKDELSNLNNVINYIGDTIDKQIDLFEDQKDAAIDALEAEKEAAEEALEAEKELVQEKIDAKQAEIDAIEDAAKARKNELDLQKAQYDLERMQNQKTMLVNSMPDTIVI